MKVIKQDKTLSVYIFDSDKEQSSKHHFKHSQLLPNSIRCIIAGPSNCGKTNLLINLLLQPNGLKYENIYIYSRSLFQPKYVFLENVLLQVPAIKYFKYTSNEHIIKPEDAKQNSIFIFDDIMCDRQDVMKSFFSMGRHKLLDVFYLAQTYARIPKHLIRDNCNLIVLFEQDAMNLKHVYDDYVNCDMTFCKFQEMCNMCWNKNKYGFIVINRECDVHSGRYRLGFDSYIYI